MAHNTAPPNPPLERPEGCQEGVPELQANPHKLVRARGPQKERSNERRGMYPLSQHGSTVSPSPLQKPMLKRELSQAKRELEAEARCPGSPAGRSWWVPSPRRSSSAAALGTVPRTGAETQRAQTQQSFEITCGNNPSPPKKKQK